MTTIECPECGKEISSLAASCPSCGFPIQDLEQEPGFRAFRKRVLMGSLVLCLIGLPAGFFLKEPFVWLVSLLGIALTIFKLSRLRHKGDGNG